MLSPHDVFALIRSQKYKIQGEKWFFIEKNTQKRHKKRKESGVW
jgi:hypothetical protein